MGIYSNSVTMSTPINVPLVEGYEDDQYSAQVAMIESYRNGLAIFDGVIRSDIQESYMKHNGTSDYEVMVFSEGVIGDLFNKIKEFFKKLWAKIKSIFHNFMARFDAKFGKSNKEFIKKYRKDIYGKDLSDFEVEYRKKTQKYLTGILPDFNAELNVGTVIGHASNDPETLDKWIQQQKDDTDYTCEWLEKTVSGISVSNPSEYEKEVMDAYFDESSKESINLTNIIDDMMAFKQDQQGFKKAQQSIDKVMSSVIKQIDKDQSEAMRHQPLTGSDTAVFSARSKYSVKGLHDSNAVNKDSRFENISDDDTQNKGHHTNATYNKQQLAVYQKALAYVHRRALCLQSVCSKFAAITLKAVKFNNTQNRRIIAKVVAYKRKEEAFSEAFADLVEWEADCVGVY